jgi:phosphate transport system protein
MHATPILDYERELELEQIRTLLLAAAQRAEDGVGAAVATLRGWRVPLAVAVEAAHDEVATLEEDCDDLCTRALVHGRLVGRELRTVIASLKIVREVSRVTELAANLAHRTRSLGGDAVPKEIEVLAHAAAAELKVALHAIRDDDADRGRSLQVRDSASNEANRAALRRLHAMGGSDPADVLALTSVCGYLERIGDHAAAIARRVV